MLQIRYKNISKGALWLVESKYTVGSGNTNAIQTGFGPARMVDILVSSDSIRLANLVIGADLRINDKRVSLLSEQNANLTHGDVFSFSDLILEVVDPKVLKALEQSESVERDVATDWSLVALNHALTIKDFPLSGTLIFGRSKACDVCFSVTHLSRRHAKIIATKTSLTVEDLNSSNGTFVNGKKVDKETLKNGDELRFDTLAFRVHGPVKQAEAEADHDRTEIRPTASSFKPKNTASAVKRAPVKNQKSKPNAAPRTEPRVSSENVVTDEDTPKRLSPVILGVVIGAIVLISAVTFWVLRG